MRVIETCFFFTWRCPQITENPKTIESNCRVAAIVLLYLRSLIERKKNVKMTSE